MAAERLSPEDTNSARLSALEQYQAISERAEAQSHAFLVQQIGELVSSTEKPEE